MQVVSLFGAFVILVAYGGSQLGRLDPRGRLSGVLNLVGSVLLAASAIRPLNAGVLVLESAWAVISLGTLVALARRGPAPPAPG